MAAAAGRLVGDHFHCFAVRIGLVAIQATLRCQVSKFSFVEVPAYMARMIELNSSPSGKRIVIEAGMSISESIELNDVTSVTSLVGKMTERGILKTFVFPVADSATGCCIVLRAGVDGLVGTISGCQARKQKFLPCRQSHEFVGLKAVGQ